MKILIPILGFGKAGGYRVLSNLANEFIKKGHKVDFLVPIFSELPYFPTTANILWVDKKGKIANKNQTDKKRGFIQIMLCLYRGLHTIKKNKYNAVLVNHSLTVWPVYFSKIKSKIYYYIQAYEPECYAILPGFKNRILEELSKWSYKLKYVKIVNAKLYCNYKSIKTKHVVYPGIDFNIFHPKKTGTLERLKLKIGTIGRIEPQKGTKYIIEAFKKLSKIKNDIILIIAFGDKDMIEGIDNVELIQPHGDEQLANFYRDIDIYVSACTVQHGAIHYPVIESMASGTAVITTPYYPANENNATIIKAENSDAIVQAVINVTNCQELSSKKIDKGI